MDRNRTVVEWRDVTRDKLTVGIGDRDPGMNSCIDIVLSSQCPPCVNVAGSSVSCTAAGGGCFVVVRCALSVRSW